MELHPSFCKVRNYSFYLFLFSTLILLYVMTFKFLKNFIIISTKVDKKSWNDPELDT